MTEHRPTPSNENEPEPTSASQSASGLLLEMFGSAAEVDPARWDALQSNQSNPTPFMSHAYLAAMESSGSATPETGWSPVYFVLRRETLDPDCAAWEGACVLYIKSHSYGEYVFDWAWADAYQRHGLQYYPKGVLAVPFTPVPGARLLARDAQMRETLLRAVIRWAEDAGLSSVHMLFGDEEDLKASEQAGLLLRHTVQFHWQNQHPQTLQPFADFDDFLASLNQEKRKKIRQERRRVQEAGVSFRIAEGLQISDADWAFFYACYERTYLEHGNAPYLSRAFFQSMQSDMPENWVLFVAERAGVPIACSLVALRPASNEQAAIAYGRYWGALERVDCLHFEACYYQPLIWCIAKAVQRFEGGAQGQHKMARALLPVQTSSAHWLAHPGFAEAIERFLEREGQGIEHYLDELHERSPFRHQAKSDL